MAHFIHDEKNNRIEGMSKEEIYALLAAAIQEGQLPQVDQNTAFVTMIKSIVDGNPYKIGFCTQAQYNAMEAGGTLEANALYIITDDTSYDDIITYIDNIQTALQDAILANAANITNLENNKVNKIGTSETLYSFINNNGNVEINSKTTDNSFQCYINVQAGGIDFYKKANGNVITFDIFDIYNSIFSLALKSQLKPTTTGVTITGGVAYVTAQGTYSINYTSSTGTVNCKAIVSVDGSTLGNYYVAGGLSSSKDADAISIGTSGSNYSITVGSGTITACKLLVAYSE